MSFDTATSTRKLSKTKRDFLRSLPRLLEPVPTASSERDIDEILLLYHLCSSEQKVKFWQLRGNFHTKRAFLIQMVLGKQ